MTLVFPFFAATAQLLLDATNCPMALLKSQILPGIALTPIPLEFAFILAIAVFAPTPQSIFSGTIRVEVTFCFPLLTNGTAFLFHAINGAVTILVSEVVSHCLSFSQPAARFLRTVLKHLLHHAANPSLLRRFL